MAEPTETPIDASWEEMVEARNHPRTPHHALLVAVRAGEMTPKQADEKCIADGLPLRHEGWEELHDITTNSVWWLPQTVLFYAWHDLTRAREQWERYQAWGRDIWRDAPDERQFNTLDEAEDALRSDLSAGIVRAFGADGGGKVRPIPCEAWDRLTFCYGRDFTVLGGDGTTAYSGVFVLRHEVVPLLISEHANAAPTPATDPETRGRPDQPAPKRGGGRPITHDWAGAAGYAAAFIIDNDYPAVEGDLTAVITTWFGEERGKAPDPRDVQRFVAEIYKQRRPTPAE